MASKYGMLSILRSRGRLCAAEEIAMFYEIKDKWVSLRIKAQPSASKSEFCEAYGDDALKIRIKAPAVEGAANKELVKFLAKSFKVSKSDILFKTGRNSKIKIVAFPLNNTFKEWIAKSKEI